MLRNKEEGLKADKYQAAENKKIRKYKKQTIKRFRLFLNLSNQNIVDYYGLKDELTIIAEKTDEYESFSNLVENGLDSIKYSIKSIENIETTRKKLRKSLKTATSSFARHYKNYVFVP